MRIDLYLVLIELSEKNKKWHDPQAQVIPYVD